MRVVLTNTRRGTIFLGLTYYLSTHGCSRVLSFSFAAAVLDDVALEALAAAAAALALLLKKFAILRQGS